MGVFNLIDASETATHLSSIKTGNIFEKKISTEISDEGKSEALWQIGCLMIGWPWVRFLQPQLLC